MSDEKNTKSQKLKTSIHTKVLFKLRLELVKLQEWIKHKRLKSRLEHSHKRWKLSPMDLNLAAKTGGL